MSRFKIKDLLINVEPEERRRQGPGVMVECPPSFTFCLGCTGAISNCGCTMSPCSLNLTDICPSPSHCPKAISTVAVAQMVQTGDLAPLIADLKQALSHLEATEQAQKESLQPQSVEEVEMLEKKLSAALEDLKARKSELQKHPPKK